MKTEKQRELVNTFLSQLGDELRPPYHELILCLTELGYAPHRTKANICFKHDLHNKQIAKMGMRSGKEPRPFFALRFSACRGYSQRLDDIVSTAIAKYPSRAAGCVGGACNFCAGEPATHVYAHAFSDGEGRTHCGAYALEIPDIAMDDVGELRELIRQEHAYLLKHEAGTACADGE